MSLKPPLKYDEFVNLHNLGLNSIFTTFQLNALVLFEKQLFSQSLDLILLLIVKGIQCPEIY